FREAKTRIRLARDKQETDRKERANMKELAKANKLYNKTIAHEKRYARAGEKVEHKQLSADKTKEVAERKPSLGKRKALEKVAPRNKHKYSASNDVGGASRLARTPTPLH
ncbi:uncharacterized protein M421DRAFT_79297, partial [Didymella exigua CBS 183.55]